MMYASGKKGLFITLSGKMRLIEYRVQAVKTFLKKMIAGYTAHGVGRKSRLTNERVSG